MLENNPFIDMSKPENRKKYESWLRTCKRIARENDYWSKKHNNMYQESKELQGMEGG